MDIICRKDDKTADYRSVNCQQFAKWVRQYGPGQYYIDNGQGQPIKDPQGWFEWKADAFAMKLAQAVTGGVQSGQAKIDADLKAMKKAEEKLQKYASGTKGIGFFFGSSKPSNSSKDGGPQEEEEKHEDAEAG